MTKHAIIRHRRRLRMRGRHLERLDLARNAILITVGLLGAVMSVTGATYTWIAVAPTTVGAFVILWMRIKPRQTNLDRP